MSIKFIVLLCCLANPILAQENCQRLSCNWDYFKLKQRTEGTIIHYEYHGHCDHRTPVSIAIVRIGQDTIRCLEICPNKEMKPGDKVFIIPQEKPRDGIYLIDYVFGLTTKKTKQYRAAKKEFITNGPTRFDAKVLKTTWGELIDWDDCVFAENLEKNSFQSTWIFFEIPDSLTGKIITYVPQENSCIILGYAAVAIVAIGEDSIRVLDFCNQQELKQGQKVKIVTKEEPSFPVYIPSFKSTANEKIVFRVNEFDDKILKTTWGKLVELP